MKNISIVERFLMDEFDLSKKEMGLYLNLVKYGPTSVLELSEITGINRATAHVNIESLTQKGLATQIKKGRGSRRLIMAEPPEKIYVILNERKAKIDAAEKQLGFVVEELAGLKQENKQATAGIEVRRYEGKDEVKLLYDDVKKAKEMRAYVNCIELIKIFPANISKFLEAHKKRPDMFIWEILEDSKAGRDYANQMPNERFEVRLTTKNLDLTAIDYMIYDGKIAVVELSSKVGVSGIIIENDNFYENAKAIHKFVWEYLPIYKK